MDSLISSDWIPVRGSGGVDHIGLERLLCSDEQWTLSLPRDDMELAALQLIISLVQATLPPANVTELRQRAATPVAVEEYRMVKSTFGDWFAIEHPENPFMQSRGVDAKEDTPIQKLFVGLPEGNNHAFFNRPGEVRKVCSGCAAVALFNQASNCPSFGGGFKGSLRGGAPVTTLANGKTLRETVWLNILTQEATSQLLPNPKAINQPNWVVPVVRNEKLHAHDIGLTRGLFWQPARVELIFQDQETHCDHCRRSASRIAVAFKKEKFNYTLEGLWPHPHSPRLWDIKKDGKDRERFLSFTTTAPAWTQLNYCLVDQGATDKKIGNIAAPVIHQYEKAFSSPQHRLRLLVSGYRNNQASILERRHELYSLPQSWHDIERWVTSAINYALQVKKILTSSLYRFHKQVGPKLHESGERLFYSTSEPLLRQLFKEMDFRSVVEALKQFQAAVKSLSRDLLETETQPYRHDPEGLKVFSLCKASFEADLAKLDTSFKTGG